MKLKPLSFYITLEEPIVKKVTSLHLPDQAEKSSENVSMYARVITVGPEVLDIKPGDYVFFVRGLNDVMSSIFDGKFTYYCQRMAILGTIEMPIEP